MRQIVYFFEWCTLVKMIVLKEHVAVISKTKINIHENWCILIFKKCNVNNLLKKRKKKEKKTLEF